MAMLRNFRIQTKLVFLISLISSMMVLIGYIGIDAAAQLSNSMRQITLSGSKALLAARMNQDILAINRAEFRVTADPSRETFQLVKQFIGEKRAEYDSRVNQLAKTADEAQLQNLAAISVDYRIFLTGVESLLSTVDEHGKEVTSDGTRKAIFTEAMSSRTQAEKLIASVKSLADAAADSNEKRAQESQNLYDNLRWMLVLISCVGIALGVGFGFALSRFGIVKPIAMIVATLRRLADGDRRHGTGRRDWRHCQDCPGLQGQSGSDQGPRSGAGRSQEQSGG
jgi:methyl-accepting chemotaxis protein